MLHIARNGIGRVAGSRVNGPVEEFYDHGIPQERDSAKRLKHLDRRRSCDYIAAPILFDAWEVSMPPKHRLLCLALMAIAALTAPGSVQSAAAQAHLTGQWTRLSGMLMPINPIHTAVLRTGKVLVVAGSENDATITTYRVAVFDPATGSHERAERALGSLL